MDEKGVLQKRLEMTKRNLTTLEQQVLAYGKSNAPGHLTIALKDARSKVAELEKQININRGNSEDYTG